MNNQAFNDLVKFASIQNKEDGTYGMPFSLNENSTVFTGHFPNQPILPGVVMVEMTKRAAQIVLGVKLTLVSAGNFKFLKMVEPGVAATTILNFEITIKEDTWRVKAQIKADEEIYFKADALYKHK